MVEGRIDVQSGAICWSTPFPNAAIEDGAKIRQEWRLATLFVNEIVEKVKTYLKNIFYSTDVEGIS